MAVTVGPECVGEPAGIRREVSLAPLGRRPRPCDRRSTIDGPTKAVPRR
jgi:hypothetical protein